jgi:hypothetical protein
MVCIRAQDSGRGIILHRPDRKPNKIHANIVCATDEQMLLAMDKYQSLMIDMETVRARIQAN